MIDNQPKVENREGRKERLAVNEVSLIGAAVGLQFKETPTIVVRPNILDFAKNPLSFYQSSGYVTRDGEVCDRDKSKDYSIGLYNLKWEALDEVTVGSVHETGHYWFWENSVWKDYVPKNREEDILFRLTNEGVALYVSKRTTDFVKDTMVDLAKRSGLSNSQIERVANEYGRRYERECIENPVTEEDVEVLGDFIKKVSDKNPLKRLEAAPVLNVVLKDVVYRLGYDVVSRFVDGARESGLTEAQALESLAKYPIKTLDEVKKILEL